MYDSRQDTQDHIDKVEDLMLDVINRLFIRASNHDKSKLEYPEKDYFDKYTPLLAESDYGSDEYHKMLDKLMPALNHHYNNNAHHPEHFGTDWINHMTLPILIEMICDWKAATERHDNGDINKSLEINRQRFDMPDWLVKLFNNTIKELGWI